MQKELRIMPRKDKPNVYLVLMTTGFICLLMCSGKRCLVLLNPTHMVIDQLIHLIQGLEKISWLLDTD